MIIMHYRWMLSVNCYYNLHQEILYQEIHQINLGWFFRELRSLFSSVVPSQIF